MAHEIMYNNFEISLVVFMPNITTNHAITYTNYHPTICSKLNQLSFNSLGTLVLFMKGKTETSSNCMLPLF